MASEEPVIKDTLTGDSIIGENEKQETLMKDVDKSDQGSTEDSHKSKEVEVQSSSVEMTSASNAEPTVSEENVERIEQEISPTITASEPCLETLPTSGTESIALSASTTGNEANVQIVQLKDAEEISDAIKNQNQPQLKGDELNDKDSKAIAPDKPSSGSSQPSGDCATLNDCTGSDTPPVNVPSCDYGNDDKSVNKGLDELDLITGGTPDSKFSGEFSQSSDRDADSCSTVQNIYSDVNAEARLPWLPVVENITPEMSDCENSTIDNARRIEKPNVLTSDGTKCDLDVPLGTTPAPTDCSDLFSDTLEKRGADSPQMGNAGSDSNKFDQSKFAIPSTSFGSGNALDVGSFSDALNHLGPFESDRNSFKISAGLEDVNERMDELIQDVDDFSVDSIKLIQVGLSPTSPLVSPSPTGDESQSCSNMESETDLRTVKDVKESISAPCTQEENAQDSDYDEQKNIPQKKEETTSCEKKDHVEVGAFNSIANIKKGDESSEAMAMEVDDNLPLTSKPSVQASSNGNTISSQKSDTTEPISTDISSAQNSTELSNSQSSMCYQEMVVESRSLSQDTIMADPETSNCSSVSVSTATTLPLDLNDLNGMDAAEQPTAMADVKVEGAEVTDEKTVEKGTENEEKSLDATAEVDEAEFSWEEYLEDTNTTGAADTAFPHVEHSLRSNFEKGMKFEVLHDKDTSTFWLATVVMPCGQLLRLRYDGFDTDGSKDFWCDAFKGDIHPLGWCGQNEKTLEPPQDVKEKLPEWETYAKTTLAEARTASDQLLGGGLGTAAVDQIKPAMLVEVQHAVDHARVWVARVRQNIGGRLLLRYEGTDNASLDFWLFYLHHRVHAMGWGGEMDMEYGPPEAVAEEWSRDEGWRAVLDKAQSDTDSPVFPGEVLADQELPLEHTFSVGQKLEAVHPDHAGQICPATVVRVLSETYVVVQLDDLAPRPEDLPTQTCCHGGSRDVLPVNWCTRNGVTLTPPNGWEKDQFVWEDYLAETQSEAAPEDCFSLDCGEVLLSRGVRLEAADPSLPASISVATVAQVVPPLLFIHLESSALLKSAHIVDARSMELYPVGWCESNCWPLEAPHKSFFKRRERKPPPPPEPPSVPEKSSEGGASKIPYYDKGSSWCPKIYFNHRCFSGPFLSKGRIAELPKCVGPGPVTLVMKEVLSMLINVAYKSSRVLRELQLDGPADPTLHQQVLKAKYKGKSYRAMVELCKSSDQVLDFCRKVCGILECCPNLFSPHYIIGNCQENCDQLSKTKYTAYCGKKKKKVGRPPGGHSNLEFGAKKPGKRRKRKRINHTKKSTTSVAAQAAAAAAAASVKEEPLDDAFEDEEDMRDDSVFHEDSSNSTTASFDLSQGSEANRKRKYTRHTAPPHEMKTRGVKLPRFSHERRSRQPRDANVGRPPKYAPIQQRRLLKQQQLEQQQILEKQQQQQKAGAKASAFQPVKKEDRLVLDTNPLWWTVGEVTDFLRTTDCAAMDRIFKNEEIDGQALLLLNLPTVQELMEVKLGPAIKLCHLIERLKVAFFEQYAC